MSDPIHQEFSYAAAPEDIFDALLSSQKFSEFTGATAKIDAREGGDFACFDGQIVGKTIELVPGERIVQAWRVAAWDEGHYSLVRFTLTKNAAGTQVSLDHSAFPEGSGEHLAAGWPKMYFEPLRAYLERS